MHLTDHTPSPCPSSGEANRPAGWLLRAGVRCAVLTEVYRERRLKWLPASPSTFGRVTSSGGKGTRGGQSDALGEDQSHTYLAEAQAGCTESLGVCAGVDHTSLTPLPQARTRAITPHYHHSHQEPWRKGCVCRPRCTEPELLPLSSDLKTKKETMRAKI